MSYADQQMSATRVRAFIIVALIHIVVGYFLVTGLAYSGARNIMKHLTTVNIEKDKPKPPPPPPPPKNLPPPPVTAPVQQIHVAEQPVAAPEPVHQVVVVHNEAPSCTPKGPVPKGHPTDWVTPDDYPPRALREMRGGSTGFRLTVDATGKATGCDVTSSSGSPDLDQATCQYATRRARFSPGMDCENHPAAGSYSSRVKWVPQEG